MTDYTFLHIVRIMAGKSGSGGQPQIERRAIINVRNIEQTVLINP
jgi:hypothetical protein